MTCSHKAKHIVVGQMRGPSGVVETAIRVLADADGLNVWRGKWHGAHHSCTGAASFAFACKIEKT